MTGDRHYRGRVALWGRLLGLAVVTVTRQPGAVGFARLPKRWVVERTFGWLQACRRLTFDYEFKPANSEGMVWLATMGILLNRLYPPGTS